MIVSMPALFPAAMEGFKIAFNPLYLFETATAFKSAGELRLQLWDELAPVVICGDTFQAVIMPMRLA